jgi:phosphate:Na+ symporter
MAERKRPWRTAVRWGLTIAIIVLAFVGGERDERPKPEVTDEPGTSKLEIVSISDADVTPGDAIVVAYRGADEGAPVEATVARKPADIIVRERDSVVVRVPRDVAPGKAGLRIVQGKQRSKAWDLHVQKTNYRKLVARLVGGLALFVFGLSLLALGVRGLAGHRVRVLLGKLTRSSARAVGVGVLVGAVTQLTSSAAAFSVSLVEARLMALAPAVAVLVGAQLGASITGALLPVALTQQSLLVIAIGVLWLRLATDRRGGAIARLVLGAGLMLYGLHLLQTSVEPLVGDPQLLPVVGYLRDGGLLGYLACAAAGAVLALVLQGPGPAYVLVVGLAQASGALPLENALALLAGTNLGAALGMALVAWQSGRATRALVGPHVLFGAYATLFALAMLPLATALADALAGKADALAYGHTVMQPHMSARIAIGFALTQVTVAAAWLGALPALVRRTAVRRSPASRVSSPDLAVSAAQRDLTRVLESHRLGLDVAFETSSSGDRARSPETEEALGEARRVLEGHLRTLSAEAASTEGERLTRVLVACLQLQRVVEQLVHVAELAVERGVRLAEDELERLAAMHKLARESCEAVIVALASGAAPDLEAAGAREIRMNLLEAEARTAAVTRRAGTLDSVSLRVGLAELIDAYEHVGNHLFRVLKALGDDGDDV